MAQKQTLQLFRTKQSSAIRVQISKPAHPDISMFSLNSMANGKGLRTKQSKVFIGQIKLWLNELKYAVWKCMRVSFPFLKKRNFCYHHYNRSSASWVKAESSLQQVLSRSGHPNEILSMPSPVWSIVRGIWNCSSGPFKGTNSVENKDI